MRLRDVVSPHISLLEIDHQASSDRRVRKLLIRKLMQQCKEYENMVTVLKEKDLRIIRLETHC